jgi:hypothetical protein
MENGDTVLRAIPYASFPPSWHALMEKQITEIKKKPEAPKNGDVDTGAEVKTDEAGEKASESVKH